jgi:hypothetical protein
MLLPLGWGDLDFSEWFRGLIAAFVSGGASAITSGITVSAMDSRDYNLATGKIYALMGAMFAVNGLMGAAMFLRNKPVPDHKIVTTTIQETTVRPTKPATTVVRTVEEVHTEPKDKEG